MILIVKKEAILPPLMYQILVTFLTVFYYVLPFIFDAVADFEVKGEGG